MSRCHMEKGIGPIVTNCRFKQLMVINYLGHLLIQAYDFARANFGNAFTKYSQKLIILKNVAIIIAGTYALHM